MAWIWTVLSVIVFLSLLQELFTMRKKKAPLPPGPRALPIIGHFHLLGRNPHKDLHRLARKHGPIMGLRFGFVPVVVVSSPTAAEFILKTHDHVFASRPRIGAAKYLSYGQRNLAFGAYGPYWRDMRKLCTLELLSNLKINQFRAMRKAELGLLVSSLKQSAQTRETVDLTARVSATTKDMSFLMLFGKKYSDRDLDEKMFKDVIAETMEVAGTFNLADYFPLIGALDLQGIDRRMKRLSKIYDGMLEKIIDDHVENGQEKKQKKDFVGTMMAILESGEAGFEFDRRHVKAVLLDLFLGGTDTSATAIGWALAELIRHPSAMKKLQKELELAVGMDNTVEESHLDKLDYLDSAVKETLRLHPVVPLLVPHESMEDCTADGFHIPKKTRVVVNAWAIGRDPNAWPEPESFSPERFVGRSIDLRGRDFQLIPFGSGRRICPGMQLGLTVVKLVVAQLVHCFDLELPDGVPPSDVDMAEHFGMVTARAKHLMIIPNYRLRI